MPSLNKVMLMGNLTKDAELRYLPGGQAVLEFRLAVTRKFRTQQGEDKEETCFIDVNLWGKRGEAVSQYLTKGKPLFVEGRLQLDEWDDKESGQKRSKMRVVAENIEFIGGGRAAEGGGEGGAPGAGGYQQQRGAGGGYGAPRGAPPAARGGEQGYARPASAPGGQAAAMQLQDEDIPF
jgi:single-strand DNA-binding protein